MEVHPHDQYTVRIDGSGRLTTRNRKFLRHFQPAFMVIQPAPTTPTFIRNDNPPSPSPNSQSYDKTLPITNEQETPLNHEYLTLDTVNDTIPPSVDIDQPQGTKQKYDEPRKEDNYKMPMTLKRLFPHNKEGIKDNIAVYDNNGRHLRNRVVHNTP